MIWDIASRIWDKLGYMHLAGMRFCGMMGASGETSGTVLPSSQVHICASRAGSVLCQVSPDKVAAPGRLFAYLGWAYG